LEKTWRISTVWWRSICIPVK